MGHAQVAETVEEFASLLLILQSEVLSEEGYIVFGGVGVVDGDRFGQFVEGDWYVFDFGNLSWSLGNL